MGERGVWRRLAGALAVGPIFAGSLVGATVIHLDLPLTRRVVASAVARVLDGALEGEVRLGPITRLAPTEGLTVAAFVISDADGEVVSLDDVRVDGAWWRSGLAVLRAPTALALPPVRVGAARVALRPTDDGGFTIARVFTPTRGQPNVPSDAEAPTRAFQLRLPEVAVARVDVDGPVFGADDNRRLQARIEDLTAAVVAGTDGVSVRVAPVRIVDEALLPGETDIVVQFRLERRSGDPGRLALGASLRGIVGGIEGAAADARLQDGSLRAWVEAPRIDATQLEALLGIELPLPPVAVRIGIEGAPTALAAHVAIDARDGSTASLSLRGHASFSSGETPRLAASLRARDIDLARFNPTWPSSRLGLEAEVATRIDGTDTEVVATLRTPRGRIDDIEVPPLRGRVGFARAGAFARLVVLEPGTTSRVDIDARAADDVDVAVSVRTSALSRVRRLDDLGLPPLAGALDVAVDGRLRGSQVDVALSGDGRRLGLPGRDATVAGMRLDARLSGSTDAPDRTRLRATAQGEDVRSPEATLDAFTVRATGPLLRPAVEIEAEDPRRRRIEVAATLDALRRVAEDVEVALERDEGRIAGRVARVGVARDGGVTVDGVRLRGAGGDLEGRLRVRDGELEGKLTARRFDVSALGRLVDRPLPFEGVASVDIDLRPVPGGGRQGFASVFIDELEAAGLEGLQVEVRSEFDGDLIVPYAVVRLRREDDATAALARCGSDVAALVLTGRATLPGALLDPESWRTLDAEGAIQLQRTELACILPFLRERIVAAAAEAGGDPTEAADAWPLDDDDVSGTVDAALQFQVDEGAWALPAFGLQTRGLVLGGRETSAPTKPAGNARAASETSPAMPSPWRTDRLDLAVSGSIDGREPNTVAADLDVSLLERRTDGVVLPVAEAALSTRLDLRALGRAATRADALRTTYFDGSLRLPKRNIRRLVEVFPTPLRATAPQPMGDIEGMLFVSGTLAEPNVGVRIVSTGVGPRRRAVDNRSRGRLGVELIGSYSQGRGRVDLDFTFVDREVLALNGDLRGPLFPLPGAPRRTGAVQGRLRNLPLDELPLVVQRGVSGVLSGDFRFDGLGARPRLSLSLDAPTLTIGPTSFERVRVAVTPDRVEPGMMSLSGALPIRGGGGRGLVVRGFGGLRWRQDLFPVPDRTRPARLDVEATEFPLSAFEPVVSGEQVGGLGGIVDGTLSLAVDDLNAPPGLDASLVIRDGEVQLPGQEITSIEALVRTRGTLLSLEEFEAEIYPGRVRGRLDVALEGLSPVLVRGELAIDEDAPVPVVLDGVPLGRASGTFDIGGRATDERLTVDIASDDLIVALPGSAQRNVQPLERHPDVRVSHPLEAPQRGRPEEDDRALEVRVALSNAEITSGNVLDVRLSTPRPLTSTREGIVGEIALLGGSLGLLGKRFTIERGRLRLDQEAPGNPDVNITAFWDAPDGTKVFIDYVGRLRPLTEDKIRFRSSPPRSQQALLTLVLLGSADGDAGDVNASGGDARAANLGQGVAAMQINQILGAAVPGLSTSLSTTEDDRIATTIKYRLTDSFTAAATVETDAGAIQANDDAGIEGTRVSVDYRFLRYFLLRGSVGIGNGIAQGLDVLFQYRF
ncbi:MAG: translocation/assembly module TamB domain-containing protein [Myxococcota bacterium]